MAGRTKVVAQGLTLAAVAGLLVLLVWKVVHDERSDVPRQVARGARPMAPSFALPRLDREGDLSLASLRGKAVIVNFWASWCDPCREEAPVLERAWREHRDAGLVVVGVDANDFKGDARAFARRNRMTYPIVHDARAGSLGDYGVKALPETFVVDRRGRIIGQIAGQIDSNDEMLARFDSFVARALRRS
jgi:cytochrome c biogenesis protein CcmG, thiol:disulfide interchange protein DsbE